MRDEIQADPHPLEPSSEEILRRLHLASERLAAHWASLPQQPASFAGDPAAVLRSLQEPLPEQGESFEALLDRLVAELAPVSFNTAGPGYVGYIPGGGLPDSALAALLADGLNRYVTVWQAAPAFAEIEASVIRWFCGMTGFPATARGYLSSGGSLANFSALVTARRERLPEDFLRGTLYCSDQVHHSVLKAAALAGFPERNVRSVATDERFRLRLDLLAEQIAADRADGWQPFFVVGSAGTTNTGAVDDLAGLADLAAAESLWLHVDAAYGGFFVLTPRGRARMAGIERADSITLDPHKGLFLPYGTGCLLVRDGDALRRAHLATAEYLRVLQDEASGPIDFCQLSPELSRGFRGLKVWLPLKLHGAEVFRRQLDEKLDLADHAAAELGRIPEIEIVAAPQLSVVAFRLRPETLDGPDLDALNQRFLERINQKQRVFLSGTFLDGRFVLRICVLSFRTHRDRLEAGLADIRAAAEEVLASS